MKVMTSFGKTRAHEEHLERYNLEQCEIVYPTILYIEYLLIYKLKIKSILYSRYMLRIS